MKRLLLLLPLLWPMLAFSQPQGTAVRALNGFSTNQFMFDSVAVLSVKPGLRHLFDGGGTTVSFDWDARLAKDASGVNSFAYGAARRLYDASGVFAVDWDTRTLSGGWIARTNLIVDATGSATISPTNVLEVVNQDTTKVFQVGTNSNIYLKGDGASIYLKTKTSPEDFKLIIQQNWSFGNPFSIRSSAGNVNEAEVFARYGNKIRIGGIPATSEIDGIQIATTLTATNGFASPQNASAPTAAEIGGSVGSVTNSLIRNVNGQLTAYWSDGTTLYSSVLSAASTATLTNAVGASFDGAGAAVAVGSKAYASVDRAGTIYEWEIIANGASPTCTIDVWKIAAGTAIPTIANTIMGTKPALSSGNVLRSSTTTGWTTLAMAKGDILIFNVDACSVATQLQFKLVYR